MAKNKDKITKGRESIGQNKCLIYNRRYKTGFVKVKKTTIKDSNRQVVLANNNQKTLCLLKIHI